MTFTPDGKTNAWLSLGFRTALNDKEIEQQNEAMKVHLNHPYHAQMLQLENIYKQMALLNYQMQSAEAKKIPTVIIPTTVVLDVLTNNSGDIMAQILPGRNNRKQVTLYAFDEPAIISNVAMASVPVLANIGVLNSVRYFIVPIGQRIVMSYRGPLYAVSNSSANSTTLSLLEEVYDTPIIPDKEYEVDRELERSIVHKSDWLETVIEDL